MQTPLRITFHGIEPSASLEAHVRAKAAVLERFCDAITSCHVTIEVPHHHHRQGNQFCVHVDVTLPGSHLVVSRDARNAHTHEDPLIAIRDSFDAAVRRLEDYTKRRRDLARQA
jgi:ribosome-associated translation inhibitor RaiA